MAKTGSQTKADTAVKLVLMFFVSLLSFSVGTYVGKQFSDSESRRAALESDYSGHETEVAEADGTEGDEMVATMPVADEDVASLSEEFSQNERNVASDETKTATEPAQHEPTKMADHEGYTHHSKMKAKDGEMATGALHANAKPTAAPAVAAVPANGMNTHTTTASAAVTTATERVANDQAPAADMKKPREPSGVLPTVATTAVGKYTVQVASYGSEKEAKEHATKLTGKGYSAFFVPAEVNGKTWYRVSVGLFSDPKSASTFRTELISTQAVTTAIVQKIVK